MKADKYLKTLTKRIKNSRMREEILREYRNHIEDCKETLMETGMSEEAAEEEAVRQMGDPAEAGQEMNRLYREGLDLGMTLWFLFIAIPQLPLRWIWEIHVPFYVIHRKGTCDIRTAFKRVGEVQRSRCELCIRKKLERRRWGNE